MDCDVMKRAGAMFYEKAHKSPAVRSILRSNLDPNGVPFLMFGFENSKTAPKPVRYVLRYPSPDQIRIFEEADPGFRERALMEAAGAERCEDFNFLPEFVAICLFGSLRVSHGFDYYISEDPASNWRNRRLQRPPTQGKSS
jgi:hypothetical protein